MTDDRRGSYRRNAFTFGAILADGAETACLVWDITGTGAQIEVEAGATVPERFALRAQAGLEPRPVAVKWRRGRRIGIAFEG